MRSVRGPVRLASILASLALSVGTSRAAPVAHAVLDPAPVRELTTRIADDAVTLDDAVRAGQGWRVETDRGPVYVWIPDGYDPATAATVVFVHGYHVDVDEAWAAFRLPQQFALSGRNAMFIVPSSPRGKADPIVWPSVNALVASMAVRLGIPMPTARLVAVGHSGAYRTLAEWLTSPTLDTIVLLDAVYGEYRFAPWARADPQRRLVNIAYETARFSEQMHRTLPGTVRVQGLPRDGLPEARIVYATTDVGHWPLVTEGVALPLALRALGIATLPNAPATLGLPPRDAVWTPPTAR